MMHRERRSTLLSAAGLLSVALATSAITPLAVGAPPPMGVGYQPYHGGNYGDCASLPGWDSYTAQAVAADMAIINQHFASIRSWTIQNSNTHTIAAAQAIGIDVHAGARGFVKQDSKGHYVLDAEKSHAEIDAIIQQANQYPGTVKTIICGNENLQKGATNIDGLSMNDINSLIDYAKNGLETAGLTSIDVTTCQIWGVWTGGQYDELFDHVGNTIWATIYPYSDCDLAQEPHPETQTQARLTQRYNQLQSAAQPHGKRVVIGETGWPTHGTRLDGCQLPIGSPDAAKTAFEQTLAFVEATGCETYWFEMFDEPWKVCADINNSENYFGICSNVMHYKYLPANWPKTPTGDLDRNGEVDEADLEILYVILGSCPGDFNLDGQVDGADLGQLLGLWGVCP